MEIRHLPEFYQYQQPSFRDVLNPGNRVVPFPCINQYLSNGVCTDPLFYDRTLDEKPSLILHRYVSDAKGPSNGQGTTNCDPLRFIDMNLYLQCLQSASYQCQLQYYQNTSSNTLSQAFSNSFQSLLFISLGFSNRVMIYGAQPLFCTPNDILISQMNNISFAGGIIDMDVSQNGQYLTTTINRNKWELDSIVRFQNICSTLANDPQNMFLKAYSDPCKNFPNITIDLNQFGQIGSVCTPGILCPSLNVNIFSSVQTSYYTFRANMEILCPPGSFCQNGIRNDCPQGFICPNSGMTKPIICPKDITLSTTCSNPKLTTPMLCPNGSICTVPYFPPLPSAPGFYSDLQNGIKTNIPCSLGEYCPLGRSITNSINDLNCPEKTFCSDPSIMVPTICGCALGNCSYCPSGSFQQNLCPAGFKCNPLNTPQILNCTIREYCPNGTVIPLLCPPGYYCPTTAESIICPRGYYCKEGTIQPVPCPLYFTCGEGTKTDPINFFGILIDIIITIGVLIIYALGNLGIYYYRKYREKRRKMAEMGLLRSETMLRESKKSKDGDLTGCLIDIKFDNLGLQLKGTGQKVLDNVSGCLRSGRVTAVMGPSGCGKSTFLTTISGRSFYGNRTGDIYLNDVKDDLTNYKNLVGFVPQEDIMLRTMTVEDILFFSAYSRLDWRTPRALVTRIVDKVIKVLGLSEIRYQVIGDEITRGISGGQRKRVNIGMELVAEPVVLFLDEPTSGLDSSSSKEVCQALSDIARKGITVATVIHQPRYEIFTMIDDVLLLGKGGKVVYHGPSKDALSYFENLGFKCPEHVNPPDFFMDIISGDVFRSNDPEFKKEDLFDLWNLKKPEFPKSDLSHSKTPKTESKSRKTLFICQSWLCFFRALKQQFHNLRGFFLDNFLFFISGLFLGITLYQKTYVGPLPQEVIDQCPVSLRPMCSYPQNDVIITVASLTPLAMALTSTITALKTFGSETAVFRRENEAGMSSLAYFLSKNLAQTFTILSAPLVYLSIFYSLFVPRGRFYEYYFALLVIVYTSFGYGYFISIVFGNFSQLVSIVFTMIMFNFSGANPTLPSLSNMIFPVNILPYISYMRYAQEGLYLIEIRNYANLYNIQTSLDIYGYNFKNLVPDIFIVLSFGIGIRILAYISLVCSLPDSYFNMFINWLIAIPTKLKILWQKRSQKKKEIEKPLMENDFLQQSVEVREENIKNLQENKIELKEDVVSEEEDLTKVGEIPDQ